MQTSPDTPMKGSPLAPDPNQADAAGVVTKVTAVWAGTLFGIQLSDLVLLVTLFYTLIQIGFLIYDRVIKPWRKSHLAARANGKIDNPQTEY